MGSESKKSDANRSVVLAEDAVTPVLSPVEHIRQMLPSLRRSDARVATILLERHGRIGSLSVSDVAESADTSESTVVRACQRLGFRGYHDAKRQLAASSELHDGTDYDKVTSEDPSGLILEKVVSTSAQVMKAALTTLDRAAFASVSETLRAARKVLVVGVGPSFPVAQDAAYRLRLLGLDVDAPIDSLTQHLAAASLDQRDVALIISHTGATRETLLSAQAALDAGATVVAITSFARSPLTQLASHALVTGGQGSGVRVEAMASRLVHLAIADALFIDLAAHGGPEVEAQLSRSHDIATEHQL